MYLNQKDNVKSKELSISYYAKDNECLFKNKNLFNF